GHAGGTSGRGTVGRRRRDVLLRVRRQPGAQPVPPAHPARGLLHAGPLLDRADRDRAGRPRRPLTALTRRQIPWFTRWQQRRGCGVERPTRQRSDEGREPPTTREQDRW